MILEKKVEREFENDVVEKNEVFCPLCGKEIDHLLGHLQNNHNWNPWNEKTLKNKIFER